MNELEQSIVSVLTAARSGGVLTRLGLIDALLSRLDFLRELLANLDEQATLDLIGKLYDQYIAPLDIPGVPNLIIEPQIDAAIKSVVLKLAESIIRRAKANEA